LQHFISKHLSANQKHHSMTTKKSPTAFDFTQALLDWFDRYGRKTLPWQQNKSPYRVWLSEIMLQQTQVSTVIDYFNTFVNSFPTIEQLANAPLDDVLQHWAGLGYYARARNLHKAAQIITQQGDFPQTLDEIMALPGIGRSTAGAILSIAFQKAHPILDGNVKRVLTRFYSLSGHQPAIDKQLWTLAAELTPNSRCDEYTQAIMDLGATVCTRVNPLCLNCPMHTACRAFASNTVSLYPTPKTRKNLPTKQAFFLIAQNAQGEFWLEQRPPQGIWGGLWSVPEFETLDELKKWCSKQHLRIQHSQILPVKRHTFSHYHLDYTPFLIDVVDSHAPHWHSFEQWQQRGLPTPINKLLFQLIQKKELV
jgi:A/G-specific adenine glycosylase